MIEKMSIVDQSPVGMHALTSLCSCAGFGVLEIGDFLVHGDVRRRNIMKAGLMVWLKDVRVSVMAERLAWRSGLHSSGMQVGTATHVKFRVLPFRVKTQGGLNWLCMAMTLLEALF
jgi:hypothetical protein